MARGLVLRRRALQELRVLGAVGDLCVACAVGQGRTSPRDGRGLAVCERSDQVKVAEEGSRRFLSRLKHCDLRNEGP